MNLKTYLNLYELLEHDKSTREQRRAFGLTHVELQNKPVEQLAKWSNEQIHTLKKPLLSTTVSSYMYGITTILIVLFFILGILSGVGLLSYSGHEPVNIIYFLFVSVFLPILTMFFTFLSMFSVNSNQSILIHISPSFWMEKILLLFPNKFQNIINHSNFELNLDSSVVNWTVIKRSQVLALVFSMGLLVSLFMVISTRDIAFAWSTTLSVTPEAFHNFLQTIAFTWREQFPWAVPSLELIEQSQYYRLGENLSTNMINNASKLGEWWKFLMFATLFYAVFLRVIMFLFSSIGLTKAIKKSLLTLNGSQKLLNDMNEAIITTSAKEKEGNFTSKNVEYNQVLNRFDSSYDSILGWSIDTNRLKVLNDSMHIISPNVCEVGGKNTLMQDRNIVMKSHGEVLLYVEAWEAPDSELKDFIEMLLEKANKIIVAPIGSVAKEYAVENREIDIWSREIYAIDSKKVWLMRSQY